MDSLPADWCAALRLVSCSGAASLKLQVLIKAFNWPKAHWTRGRRETGNLTRTIKLHRFPNAILTDLISAVFQRPRTWYPANDRKRV